MCPELGSVVVVLSSDSNKILTPFTLHLSDSVIRFRCVTHIPLRLSYRIHANWGSDPRVGNTIGHFSTVIYKEYVKYRTIYDHFTSLFYLEKYT